MPEPAPRTQYNCYQKPTISKWQVKAGQRLGQLNKPGLYRLTLIVEAGGVRKIAVEDYRPLEVLGE